MSYSLRLDQVTKHFGDNCAVDSISANIGTGTIYGFLGPNGAGKTTTIRMIMSILYPDSGEISVLGSTTPESVKDRLGYLPEEKGLYKKMKTGDLVTYFGRLKGMSGADAKRRATELLDQFGLGHCIDWKCDALSKGMGQKVQIAATIVHHPELVILDEPFSGLDPINVEVVRNVILQLKQEGRTVIFSTHIMEQAEQICDSILLVNKGKKIIDGTINEVKADFEQTIKVEFEGEGDVLNQIQGVNRVNNMGNHAEISLNPGADPQVIMRAMMDQLNIRQFSIAEPSLHEIFVRAVKESD